MAPLEDLA